MRTVADIKKEITDSFIANPTIIAKYELTPGQSFEQQFSKVSLESIFFYVVAFSIWTLENILNISISQQNTFIAQMKIHSFTWYSMFAKKFQFGTPLPELPWGEVEYDNAAFSEDEIATMQVVKFANVTKTPGGLMVKIAGLSNNELEPIGVPEFAAFKEYMFRISAAGDNLYYTNESPDSLKLSLKIFYDPLVLNSQGKRLDGTNDTPVQDAITEYIKGMDFDGKFIPMALIDKLQQVEGIKIPHLIEAFTKYGLLAWMAIPPDGVNPFAGYVRVTDPNDLTIEYIAG